MQCLEENYSSKKDELEEKIELLESAQEQVMELNAKVAMLSVAPDDMSEFFVIHNHKMVLTDSVMILDCCHSELCYLCMLLSRESSSLIVV